MRNVTAPEDLIKSKNLFPVVGIGASAGGLDAFKKLLAAVPEDSGMAFVLVQHLSPAQDSFLPELLQKITKIPVEEIADDVHVEPNTIYIIPSNKMLIANDGVLQLSPRPEKSEQRINMPIDLFFSSLAEIHQEHAIGVVLSGTATDGTLGLKAIKDHGGITFAQDAESADFDGMPQSAIGSGVVDFVLPPEEIIPRIIELKKAILSTDDDMVNLPKQEADIYKQAITVLRMRKGTDFTFYKQATIRRRILRRIALTNSGTAQNYLEYLRKNPAEQDILYQNLLIPVTEFFRDHKVFDKLCSAVFPELLKNKTPDQPIRVWIAGCSTGQEVYSIAICLKEYLGDQHQKVQIFATDISEPAIAKARSGIYSKQEVAGLSNYRLSENFNATGDSYQVNKALRDMCIFAVHNFLKDPPFGNMDFVACRNVLIYMEPYLQKKALTTFHYALNPKGYLLLGKSESINIVSELFATTIHQDKLFTRKNAPSRFMHVATPNNERYLDSKSAIPEVESPLHDFKKTADEILLSNYTPPGVIINEAMDIVQFRGNTSGFLRLMSGKPSHNLMKLAKPELTFELRNLLSKAKKSDATVIKDRIPVEDNGVRKMVKIEALQLPNTVDPHFLVLFSESPQREADGSAPSVEIHEDNLYKDSRIKHLEMELAHLRDDMRTVTEEQEVANEELQSANEELLSGSEELQSLNEELETGKEELQSTNEELTVMNYEMVSLNEQLNDALDYNDAIIDTIHEPLVVLDPGMKVKSANNAFYKIFALDKKETDGQSIFQIGEKQWDLPDLNTVLSEVLPSRKNLIDHEVTFDLPRVGRRTMLLNARQMTPIKSKEMLILVVLEDITERTEFQHKEIELLNRFKKMLTSAPVAVIIVSAKDYTIEIANDFCLKLMGKQPEIKGMSIFDAMPELDKTETKKILEQVTLTGSNAYSNEHELQLIREDKDNKAYFDIVYQPVFEADNSISGVIIVLNEVTDVVVARKKMELQATMTYNLLMTAPGFVCTMTGPDHVYSLVNERYQQLFGSRDIKGKPILEALPELEGQGFKELLDEIYTTGQPYIGIEIPITLARDVGLEPELRYFNFSYQPMFDEHNDIFAILVFGYEVTEEVNAKNGIMDIQRKHAEELEEKIAERTSELQVANKQHVDKNIQLLKLNNELESFNYISSHDLQEPLRKIQIFTGLILDSADSANMSLANKDHFLRIQSSAWRMQTLIQDLLSYSQASIGERRFAKVDLSFILNSVINDLSEQITEANAVVHIGQVCEINVDSSQFRQVIANLVGNSLKYIQPGVAPYIEIDCTKGTGAEFAIAELDSQKKYCRISVKDNGIGIDPKYYEKIFEVFQRLHQKDKFAGTGIGLAIVKKIVENHSGIIKVVSEIGHGATFEIYIPDY